MGRILPKKLLPQDWTEVPKYVNFKLSENERKTLFVLLHSGYGRDGADCFRKAFINTAEQLGVLKEKVDEFFDQSLKNQR